MGPHSWWHWVGKNGEHSSGKCEEQVLLKHAHMCNKDFQPTSRYVNLWLCSVWPPFFHKQTTSRIRLYLEDLLWWSGSSWNVVSGCYIPPIDTDVNQTECSMLKYSITKMAVDTKCSSTLLALHCLWCLWAILTINFRHWGAWSRPNWGTGYGKKHLQHC